MTQVIAELTRRLQGTQRQCRTPALSNPDGMLARYEESLQPMRQYVDRRLEALRGLSGFEGRLLAASKAMSEAWSARAPGLAERVARACQEKEFLIPYYVFQNPGGQPLRRHLRPDEALVRDMSGADRRTSETRGHPSPASCVRDWVAAADKAVESDCPLTWFAQAYEVDRWLFLPAQVGRVPCSFYLLANILELWPSRLGIIADAGRASLDSRLRWLDEVFRRDETAIIAESPRQLWMGLGL